MLNIISKYEISKALPTKIKDESATMRQQA